MDLSCRQSSSSQSSHLVGSVYLGPSSGLGSQPTLAPQSIEWLGPSILVDSTLVRLRSQSQVSMSSSSKMDSLFLCSPIDAIESGCSRSRVAAVESLFSHSQVAAVESLFSSSQLSSVSLRPPPKASMRCLHF